MPENKVRPKLTVKNTINRSLIKMFANVNNLKIVLLKTNVKVISTLINKLCLCPENANG